MFAEPDSAQIMKGSLLDLEFTMDIDHRKRRRNRTTQSCLNCHTSKRKCDRKRPCQRCIQLGLTGLCVYEVDDPALRDDPDVDEATRLRGRIAELESLVRELRGKPHPRWADPRGQNGDANEKWHSRSYKRSPDMRRPRDGADGADRIAVKTEPGADMNQACYYRLSPSPPVTPASYGHYGPPNGVFNGGQGTSSTEGGSPLSYSPSTSSPPNQAYSPCVDHGHAAQNGLYPIVNGNDAKSYTRPPPGAGAPFDHYSRYSDSPPHCSCLSNPGAGSTFINLSRTLQSTANYLQHMPEHGEPSRCDLYRRIHQLTDILHNGGELPKATSPYGAFERHPEPLRSPPDSDLMTPLSVSSHHPPVSLPSPATPHSLQSMPWEQQNGNYNPYFPQLPPMPHGHGKGNPYDVVT